MVQHPEKPAWRVWAGALIGVAAALAVGGCGLSEYEDLMSSEQRRLQQLDEEAKHLGEPLEGPKQINREGEKEPMWHVFLRPPKGVSTSPDDKLFGNLLAQYSGNPPFKAVYLGVAEEKRGDTGRKSYIEDVLKLFPADGASKSETVTVKGPSRSITVIRYTYNDTSSGLSLNFYQTEAGQAVVVYRFDKDAREKVSRAIDMSVATLGIEAEADRLRNLYNRTHKKKKK